MPTKTSQGNPPTTELGLVLQGTLSPSGMAAWGGSWGNFIDEQEWVPELIWPRSVETYTHMRTDSQVSALYAGTTLPIRRYDWMIDPNGAPDEMVQAISTDLNLPIEGEEQINLKPQHRYKRRFSFHDHIRKALLALVYGHAYFEQVGEIAPEDGKWHLRKLAERPQTTIADIECEIDGGLVRIRQNITPNTNFSRNYEWPSIPVERLVAYVWEQEAGSWVGRSLLRDVYKNWLIKDRLVRIDAINHERAGGVPYIVGQPGATPGEMERLHQMAREFKVGDASGGAVPFGAQLELARASNTNVVDSMRYHDEAMARKFLLMMMQLGQTQTGSRALGQTFHDFFAESQQTIADWFVDTFNEHVIEDWVDWNYGEDVDPVPRLKYNVDVDLAVTDLKAMIDAKAIIVDDSLEEALRKDLGLPNKDPDAPSPLDPPEPSPIDMLRFGPGARPPGPPPAPNASIFQTTGNTSSTSSAFLLPNDRTYRRRPYDHEIEAQTDFDLMDRAWRAELDNLVREWLRIRERQAQGLAGDVISARNNLRKLANLSATPEGAALIQSALQKMAAIGAREAEKEAIRQGLAQPASAELQQLEDLILSRARAMEDLMAESLSMSARAKSIQLSGGEMPPQQVSKEVQTHLNSLSTAYLEEQFGGALTAAQNDGRRVTMLANNPTAIYASEILDQNTCEPCRHIDGRPYPDLSTAALDYPAGGYAKCSGGPRCRGTLVAVYREPEGGTA
jgi:hypothetical protein